MVSSLHCRWKECYCVLTYGYLSCYKTEEYVGRAIPAIKVVTKHPTFACRVLMIVLVCLFVHIVITYPPQIPLTGVTSLSLECRKGYLTICLTGKEGRTLLRCWAGIEEWYNCLQLATSTDIWLLNRRNLAGRLKILQTVSF